MRWIVTCSFLAFLFLATVVSPASASLVDVTSQGEVVWKVLSSEDSVTLGGAKKPNDIQVKKVADASRDGSIVLKKDSDKLFLAVNGRETLDITSWDSDVVQLEEREDTKKINISVSDGSFVIDQEGIQAKTDSPISIDPKQSGLSVATASGSAYLAILPVEAVETALRSRQVTSVDKTGIEIKEDNEGNLAYGIEGERDLKILNIIDLKVPVKTYISTTTGEVLNVDQPKWLSIFGFLFS